MFCLCKYKRCAPSPLFKISFSNCIFNIYCASLTDLMSIIYNERLFLWFYIMLNVERVPERSWHRTL